MPVRESLGGRGPFYPAMRFAFFATVDAALVVTAFVAALALRFDGDLTRAAGSDLLLVAPLAAGTLLAALQLLGLYRVSWAHVSLREVVWIGLAVAAMTLVTGGVVQATHWLGAPSQVPRSVLLIQAPITFCLLAMFRLSKRATQLMASAWPMREAPPTLLVGAGVAGAQVLRSIQLAKAPYSVIGFVDDDKSAWGTSISGVRVLGGTSMVTEIVRAHQVDTVIVCVATATRDFVRTVTADARVGGAAHVRIVPPVSQIVDGQVSIEKTTEVSLQDLLGRDAVQIDALDVRTLIQGRNVLVTGGAGTIGSELCRQIARFGPSTLVIVDNDETRLHEIGLEIRGLGTTKVQEALADVRDRRAIRQLFQATPPAIVFHAAAYKHVPMMERWPLSALDVNVLGTCTVAEEAESAGCERFVFISTDKAVEPSSIMGASKRLAELALFAERSPRMVRSAVRFGNVIGSRGSVIPLFERQLREGGPLTVTHPEVERYFMMTSEAVSLVLQAAVLGGGGDIFILQMGKPVRIAEVAREFIRLHGLEPDQDIRIVYTGLRPGEKLSEELAYAHERLVPTTHPQILATRMEGVSYPRSFRETIDQLVASGDHDLARAYFRREFPTLSTFGSAASLANRHIHVPTRKA